MATLGGIAQRLGYLRFLASPSTWRWIVDAVDYLVEDHLEPGRKLTRGELAIVHPSTSFRSAQNIFIGSHTRIQPGCVLWASPNSRIRIGDFSGLGPGTRVFSSNHRFEPGEPYYRQPWNEKDVTIGENVWVGAGCTILPGVSIGDNAVVAAGAVVSRDIPENMIVGGIPARVLRSR